MRSPRVNNIIAANKAGKFEKMIVKQQYRMETQYRVAYSDTFKLSLINLKNFYSKKRVNKKLKMLLKRDMKELARKSNDR